MTDLEIVASLESALQEWLDHVCEEAYIGWTTVTLAKHMAISASQLLWVQRDTTDFIEVEGAE